MESLILPFIGTHDHPEFVYGWESCQFYEHCKKGGDVIGWPIHAKNLDQIELILQHFLYDYSVDTSGKDGDWVYIDANRLLKFNPN